MLSPRYSKCDFCSYSDHTRCLFPEELRDPRDRVQYDPCKDAISRMMEIMKCEITHHNKQVEINKNINHNNHKNNKGVNNGRKSR